MVFLVAAIALNAGALGSEDGIVPDQAFGPLVLGILLAVAAVVAGIRSAAEPGRRGTTPAIVAIAGMCVLAAIGAAAVVTEPAVFNDGYGCLGRTDTAWLAVALRPTPAPCGYLIPAADTPLFYPSALAAIAAAALGAAGAALMYAGRVRPR